MKQENKLLRSFLIFLAFVALIAITFVILKKNQERITDILLKRTSSYDNLDLLPWDFQVMTFHINHAQGNDGKNDVQRIADIINAQKPAIVCLSGVDLNTDRSRNVDQARKIAALTGMEFTFSRTDVLEGGWQGNAILTRFPIYFSENKLYPAKANEPRHSLLHAILLLNEQKIHVFSTELSTDTTLAKQELHQMVEFIQKWSEDKLKKSDTPINYLENEAVIITGCLNLAAETKAVHEPELYFTDIAGLMDEPQLTFPAKNPEQRTDYIFINDKLTPVSGAVIDNETTRLASTHLPFIVHLRLKSSGPGADIIPD